tara:strand:- start:110 stop:328 length:219 start_codon:yes stop_codon:yes gene_type:complete
MTKLIRYLKALIENDSKESSKRFLALYTVLCLATYAVVGFTNKENVVLVIAELLSFAIGVLGITAWQKIKNN